MNKILFFFLLFVLLPQISLAEDFLPLYFTPKKFTFDNQNEFTIHLRLDEVEKGKLIYRVYLENQKKNQSNNRVELSIRNIANNGLDINFFDNDKKQSALLKVWFKNFQKVFNNKKKVKGYYYEGIWILDHKDFNNIKSGCDDLLVYDGIEHLQCNLWSAGLI